MKSAAAAAAAAFLAAAAESHTEPGIKPGTDSESDSESDTSPNTDILLLPGDLAISTVNARVADDLAYRAQQSAFVASTRRRVPGPPSAGPKSLGALAVRRVAESLRYDVVDGLRALQKCPQIVQEMVLEYMHYVSFRGLQQLSHPAQDQLAEAAVLDTDIWVLKNELAMRQEPAAVAGLLTLDDNLDIVFPGSTVRGECREIRRRHPPKSNFCMFDGRKSAVVRIQNTTASYIRTFGALTAGVLDGLDWANVVVAGGIALNTLLRVEGGERPEEQQAGSWVSADLDSDIDLYIYGLATPAAANEKVKHIHAVWCRNVDRAALAAGMPAPQKLIVRSSRTVNFLSDYPHRRIQVILKLVASPTEVLLNFDLDPCAIGFTGTTVFFLPRCARSIETGYTVFTTDLVEGHHLGDRRETQLPRIYKYADRGFGIRILPQYIRHLRHHHFRFFVARRRPRPSPSVLPERVLADTVKPADLSAEELEHIRVKRGLKLLRMLAFFTDDFVHRLWVGPTARSKYVDSDDEDSDLDLGDPDGESHRLEVNIGHFDGRRQGIGASPHGRKGLGGLELLCWHESLWRKELEGLLNIMRDSFLSPSYEPDGYAELPKYEWNAAFKAQEYANAIKEYNAHLYNQMRKHHEFRLGFVPPTTFGDYFSRRTERLTYSTTDDIAAVLQRDLALPVFIPHSFERFANTTIETILPNAPRLLIPVYEYNTGGRIIPEAPHGTHNWVFWCIGADLSWACIDRRFDEVFELLWEFFNLTIVDSINDLLVNTPDLGIAHAWTVLLQKHLSRRGQRAPVADAGAEWPSPRETWAFQRWVRKEPVEVDGDSAGYQCVLGHPRFKYEDMVLTEDEEVGVGAPYWGGEYEQGGLGDWLLWGEEIPVGKRKRESVGGAPPKRMGVKVKVKEEEEEEEEEGEEISEEEEGEEMNEEEESEGMNEEAERTDVEELEGRMQVGWAVHTPK